MSSHPNRDPLLWVWQITDGVWTWTCDACDSPDSYSEHDTHAEALAAALNHCKKANQP